MSVRAPERLLSRGECARLCGISVDQWDRTWIRSESLRRGHRRLPTTGKRGLPRWTESSVAAFIEECQ